MSERLGPQLEFPVGETALREHLREVLESQAFQGSRRSQQFLQHIVEKVLKGHADELKERNLGVELFGRPPSYDTGEDAIVRVTASDVRRRLQQFYATKDSEIRIDLHSGSYAPEIRRGSGAPAARRPAPRGRPRIPRLAIWVAAGLAVVVLAALWASHASSRSGAREVMPWSYFLRQERRPVVVLSDPDISVTQKLASRRLSLSDYANGTYLPDVHALTPEMQRALRTFRGANVPVVDVGIALKIAHLAEGSPAPLRTRAARSMKLADFKTDEDFVLLGSPSSDPWHGLFQDSLDFDFVYDEASAQEVIRNKKPRTGELERYVPTARGWGTGQAFAIVALVGNPSQSGKVLLLAGTSAEATEAAGNLATNPETLAPVLQKCGVDPHGPPRYFEMLLEVRTMAGSPGTFDVKTCHRLEDRTAP